MIICTDKLKSNADRAIDYYNRAMMFEYDGWKPIVINDKKDYIDCYRDKLSEAKSFVRGVKVRNYININGYIGEL